MTKYRYNGFIPYGAGDCFIIDTYTSPDGVNSFDGNATEEAIRLGYAFVENGETAVLRFPNGSCAEFVKL